MMTAGWLEMTPGINPAARVLGWLTTGAFWPLFGLAFVLKAVDIAIQRLLRATIHGEFIHRTLFGIRTTRTLQRIMPSLWLAAVLPGFKPREGLGYRLVDQSLVGIGQRLLVMTADSLAEEGLFRGVPYVVALWVGSFKLGLVGLGTLLWALLHGTGRGIAILLSNGWLLAGLWLAGHWELAVGLHLGTNLVLYTVYITSRRILRR